MSTYDPSIQRWLQETQEFPHQVGPPCYLQLFVTIFWIYIHSVWKKANIIENKQTKKLSLKESKLRKVLTTASVLLAIIAQLNLLVVMPSHIISWKGKWHHLIPNPTFPPFSCSFSFSCSNEWKCTCEGRHNGDSLKSFKLFEGKF